jgi:hypothetical protein
LGARIGFLGVDARTERTRHRVNYQETYDLIFNRLETEYAEDANLKHLIVLLGVPIAYPRLQWLENFISSPLIAPLRLLNRRFGFAGGLFNKFDGQVDLLDDLDDHYTSKHHKAERRELVRRLQSFSKKHSVRVTILGGDVHLAAIGRFYSRPTLQIAAENDWRYMVNVVSSAITNKPPPQAVANLLARRDKVHHLDIDTDERMLDFFDHDPGRSESAVVQHRVAPSRFRLPGRKTAERNRITMPSRNYAILCESGPVAGWPVSADAQAQAEATASSGDEISDAPDRGAKDAAVVTAPPLPRSELPAFERKRHNTRLAMHAGELSCGSTHPAASSMTPSRLGGEYGLDVTLRVEVDKTNAQGLTEGYGFTVPGLDCRAYSAEGQKW